ncbi:MAG TPA: helix-turn-helix transcriptional regulator, partial [Longimicrobiales bacterium]|nr:helix-turn-helix transcriptional regulator [Longimicrobiales bacterium]
MTPPDAFLPLTPVTLQILLSLTRGPLHGYGMKRDVEDRTDGRVRLGAGTLYAGLQRMEADGLIEESEAPEELEGEANPRWRFYAVTVLGRRVLEAELRR